MSADDYKLNSNQHAAIKYISGPLLIVAGAGTGKTTTLVEKIKYLITKKKSVPRKSYVSRLRRRQHLRWKSASIKLSLTDFFRCGSAHFTLLPMKFSSGK